MIEKLKPCPFCHTEAELYHLEESPYFWVRCKECNFESESFFTEHEAIDAWNKKVNLISTTELKPCPFCGGMVSICLNEDSNYLMYCKNCSAGIVFYDLFDLQEAIEAWNRRQEK